MRAGFSKNEDWDFEIRIALGEARSGATDPGEVLAAVDGLRPGDAAGWLEAWTALGHRVLDAARASLSAGRATSAASGFLRAASYLARAVNAAAEDDDESRILALYREHREAWEAFLDASGLAVERLSIPLPGTGLDMPAWFVAVDAVEGRERRPAMIGVNGSDGPITSMWSAIGRPAHDRGYQVLLFDGPGQQSMLFEQRVPFVRDFAPVLGAVIDALAARPDVDPDRIAAYGISQGGYWLPQALADEHRVAAAIADPGVVDVAASWMRHLPGSMRKLLEEGRQEAFDREMGTAFRFMGEAARTWRFRARPFLADGPFATLRAVQAFDSRAALPRVTTPLFVSDPEGEAFWPGQSAELAALVPGATLVPFTAAEGADLHCEPLGRAVFEQRAFDWLDGVLGG